MDDLTANKVSRCFIVWSSKAQTSKQVWNFILNWSGNRALSKHWIMIFYYLFGTEFSSGNQAPSCWFKHTSYVHKTYLLRHTSGVLMECDARYRYSNKNWLINDILQIITWTRTVYKKNISNKISIFRWELGILLKKWNFEVRFKK